MDNRKIIQERLDGWRTVKETLDRDWKNKNNSQSLRIEAAKKSGECEERILELELVLALMK